MPIWLYITSSLLIVLSIWYIFFYILSYKIARLEEHIIQMLSSRTDILPALYEATKWSLTKHSEIFHESITLRKQEFSLLDISRSLESFMKLEERIHHEINFIFQVCNKNPKLLKQKEFLYLRDVMMQKSLNISKEVKKYKKIIEIYNNFIKIKNYSIIWLVIPFSKKVVL